MKKMGTKREKVHDSCVPVSQEREKYYFGREGGGFFPDWYVVDPCSVLIFGTANT